MSTLSVAAKSGALRIGKAHLRADGLFEVELQPNELFGLEDAKEVMTLKTRLCGKLLTPNLWIIGAYTNPDHEARTFASLKENAYFRSADGFVIKSLSQKIVANFYLKVNKPPVPTRFFSDKNEAVRWLLRFTK